MFTRFALAKRWDCSTRKIDRLREDGLLAWVDLSQGRGGRPCVRFLLEDIEEYERRARLCPSENPKASRIDPEAQREAQ